MEEEEDHFLNKILDGKYSLIEKLGSGTHGSVYKAKHIVTEQNYAVKIEPTNIKNSPLKIEYTISKAFSGQNGFARIYGLNEIGDNRYLVLELLGKGIDHMLKKQNDTFSLTTTLLLADQMIDRIEKMHSKFYIHRDIKPENFLLGENHNSNIVYLIDFGVAKMFYDSKKNKHIPFKESKEFRGTIRYASINAHLGYELSRRDDMESLGYSFILFLQGKLPWMGIVNQNYKMSKAIISDLKKNTPIEKLCNGMPVEFIKYLQNIRELKFDQKPNYNYLKSLFQNLLLSISLGKPIFFDWENQNKDQSSRFQRLRSSPDFMNDSHLGIKVVESSLINTNSNENNIREPIVFNEIKQADKCIEKNRKLSILLDFIEKEIDLPEIPNENKIINKVKESKAFNEFNTLSAKKGKKSLIDKNNLI